MHRLRGHFLGIELHRLFMAEPGLLERDDEGLFWVRRYETSFVKREVKFAPFVRLA